MTDLTKQREELAFNLKYGTNPDAFPGSADWHEAQAAKKALTDFDADHPEVKAKAQAKAAERKAYKNDLNSHYSRALRMED